MTAARIGVGHGSGSYDKVTIMKLFTTAGFAAIGLGIAASAANAQELDRAVQVSQQLVQDGAQSQERVDQLDNDRERLLREYRSALQQIERLERYNNQQRKLIASQEREITSLQEQIDSVTQIKREVSPMMGDMLGALTELVANDIPLLKEERDLRVLRLNGLMDDADISESEKYRLLLEAFQIESDYGRALEAYQGPLLNDPEEREVNYLMYGRVALVYLTLDDAEAGIWDKEAGDWRPLPGEYRDAIRTGIRIAEEQIPPDLVAAPVPGPIDATQ